MTYSFRLFTDQEALSFLAGRESATTTDMQREFECSRSTARRVLLGLVEQGLASTAMVKVWNAVQGYNHRARAYQLTDKGREAVQ